MPKCCCAYTQSGKIDGHFYVFITETSLQIDQDTFPCKLQRNDNVPEEPPNPHKKE